MNPENFAESAAKLLTRRPDDAVRLKAAGIDIPQLVKLARSSNGGSPPHEAVAMPPLPSSLEALAESIIEVVRRPTVFVSGDDFELPVDAELARRLKAARPLITARLASVGLVEVFDGTQKWPIGTAWMVAENIAITNRHVAEKFATADEGGKPVLLNDLRGRPYKVTVDFREEHGSTEEAEAAIKDVIYLARHDNAVSDIALLQFAPGLKLPPPIPVLGERLPIDSWVAVIGYPQPDDRIPAKAREVEENYFSNVYGVKRLSPGQIDKLPISNAPNWLLAHDATTLGGNSGSVILDLKTGSAAGLHFRGDYRVANYGVDADEIRRVLAELKIASTRIAPAAKRPRRTMPAGEEEAVENLDAFKGYAPDFISPRGSKDFEIPLPDITEHAPGKVAKLKDGGTELRYRNFSVTMNRSRRMCYFSAVNINGKQTFSIKGARPPWKIDRRLDDELQIIEECYGAETAGKFSRGHMTRREDPNWGKERDEAVISNRHTFYVTNACPQMQPFNAGIWLSLEEYALENCDQADMRISVFTGPIFRSQDPDYFEVKVPVEFWKIIAFKHDETKELCATGYIMSQRDVLPTQDEFVFGQFRESQVTIRQIEKVTGLSFHHLRDHDPLDDGSEAIAVQTLRTPGDIVFSR